MKVLFLLLFFNYSLWADDINLCAQEFKLLTWRPPSFYREIPNILFIKNAIMLEQCLSYTTWKEMIYIDLFPANYKHSKKEFALVKNKYKIFEQILFVGGDNIQIEKIDILILMMESTILKAIENNYGTLEDFESYGSEKDFEEWKKMF